MKKKIRRDGMGYRPSVLEESGAVPRSAIIDQAMITFQCFERVFEVSVSGTLLPVVFNLEASRRSLLCFPTIEYVSISIYRYLLIQQLL